MEFKQDWRWELGNGQEKCTFLWQARDTKGQGAQQVVVAGWEKKLGARRTRMYARALSAGREADGRNAWATRAGSEADGRCPGATGVGSAADGRCPGAKGAGSAADSRNAWALSAGSEAHGRCTRASSAGSEAGGRCPRGKAGGERGGWSLREGIERGERGGRCGAKKCLAARDVFWVVCARANTTQRANMQNTWPSPDGLGSLTGDGRKMTTTTPTFDCIAERELEYRATPDGPVQKAIVRLGRPYYEAPPPGEEDSQWGRWVGPFEIEIEGGAVRSSSRTYGMDAVQALQLAMVMIGLDLEHLYPGEFNIEGGNGGETGFPTTTT